MDNAGRFAREGAVQVNSDDYWTPEEHEAWATAIARDVAQEPPRALRRHPRAPLRIRARFRIVGRTAPIPTDDPFAHEEV